MFSSPGAGKSVDSLSALSPGSRHEVPLHSSRAGPGFGRPRSRRSSTASSVHSIGGVLDGPSNHWAGSLHESGQNAISTLLQPPIIRTGLQAHSTAPASSAHRPPTARDIPPVTLTNIAKVETEQFASYLSQVGALYEQLRRAKESEDDAPPHRRSSRQDDQSETTGGHGHLRPGPSPIVGRKGSNASLSSINSIETTSPVRRTNSGLARKGNQGLPPLSTIPNVYFEEDFHLENPRTFDVVSERSEVIRPTNAESRDRGDANGAAAAPRKALATNAILQEKLSWYMDTIEVHLINSISTASTTFFTALGSLKELHSEAADSVLRIKTLRKELAALDEEVVSHGLDIVQKRRRQENIQQLNDAVLQLRQIVEGVANCDSLVDAGEVDKALENMDGLEKLIAGERVLTKGGEPLPRLRNLSGASALQGVNADLHTLRTRIGQAYEQQFTEILLKDLRRHSESVSLQDILLRWSNAASRSKGHARSPSVFPTYLTHTDELKAQLFPSMFGLHRAQHISPAVLAHRDAILREIKRLIRRPLPSSNDDDNESMMSVSTASGGRGRSGQEKSSILARNLRALDPEDAEDLLANLYVGVTETLRRLTTQVKVLLDIASSLSHPNGDGLKSPSSRSPSRSPMTSPRPDRGFPGMAPSFELQEEIHKTLDINNLLGQVVDVANEKIVKILKVRTEQSTNLPLDFFLRYFTLNLYFANECEAISGRSGTPLKTVVNNQIKDFVQKNREAEIQKLAQGMKSDIWDARDFNDKSSQLLEEILTSSTHNVAAWTDRTKIYVPYNDIEKTTESASTKDANGTSKDAPRTATIDSEKFVLPNSATLCLEGIANFLHLIMGIPSMTTDIASSLIAYLQMFNSLCTQLILGAGATVSAGLKNITTKHLALASQALSFISTLIPHVRECVRRHAGSGAGVSGLMGEFDKIRRLLQEHQDNIHQKLVDIMSGRAAIHAKSMRAVRWDAEKAESNIHPYIQTLVKETSTLHRALSKHLPERSVDMIMGPVFSSYADHLGSALDDAEPKTQAGIDSMTRDVDYLVAKLSKIDGFQETETALRKIIDSKKVESKEPDPPAPDDTAEAKEAKSEGEKTTDRDGPSDETSKEAEKQS